MGQRIVSLIASSTEIVCALGFEADLVGRSHECDYPESILRLPACTHPKIDPKATSKEIDRQVKQLVGDAVSVYRVNTDRLKQLKPDVIITQTQCEVCAVSLKDVEAALKEDLGFSPKLVALQPNNLKDVWADIQRVADALGAKERAHKLITGIKSRMHSLAVRVSALPRKTVVCLEWIDPPMASGNWMPELVELSGGTDLLGLPGKHSPFTTIKEIAEKDPEVLIILPCGFDLKRTRSEMAPLASTPGWFTLRAVKNGNVFIADGNQFFNRPGPRLAESQEILTEIIHRDSFRFGHEGHGWEPWWP